MMYVHVSPGLSQASIVSGGSFNWLEDTLGNNLGRASVATLSLISGYLLVRTAASLPVLLVARRRFRTLLVPMLVWNLIYCLLVWGKVVFLGYASDNALVGESKDLLAMLTGLTGPTANLSLFFLRDLFVSLIVVRLILQWLRRFPVLIMMVFGAATLLDWLEPVIFRPSILFFVCAGAVYAQRASDLTGWLTPKILALVGVSMAVGLFLLRNTHASVASEAEDLMRRVLLIFLTLMVCSYLVGTRAGGWLAEFEPRIFETYLMHVPLISILWMPWSAYIGGAQDYSYTLFFLSMPVVAMGAGQILGALIDGRPPVIQMMLRGKNRNAWR